MKVATLKQGNRVLNLILEKEMPPGRLDKLLDSRLLSDLLDADISGVSRDGFRESLGLPRLSKTMSEETRANLRLFPWIGCDDGLAGGELEIVLFPATVCLKENLTMLCIQSLIDCEQQDGCVRTTSGDELGWFGDKARFQCSVDGDATSVSKDVEQWEYDGQDLKDLESFVLVSIARLGDCDKYFVHPFVLQ